jgi:hypothetical protein
MSPLAGPPRTCVRGATLKRRDWIGTGEGSWGPRPPLWLVHVSVVLCVCVCVRTRSHPMKYVPVCGPPGACRCTEGGEVAVRDGGRGAAVGGSPVRREVIWPNPTTVTNAQVGRGGAPVRARR